MYNHPMRRSERELSFEQAVEIMNSGSWGVLSTVGADGYPYGVPVNYAYDDGKIYFHCAKNSGHKQENLIFSGTVKENLLMGNRNPNVRIASSIDSNFFFMVILLCCNLERYLYK